MLQVSHAAKSDGVRANVLTALSHDCDHTLQVCKTSLREGSLPHLSVPGYEGAERSIETYIYTY